MDDSSIKSDMNIYISYDYTTEYDECDTCMSDSAYEYTSSYMTVSI